MEDNPIWLISHRNSFAVNESTRELGYISSLTIQPVMALPVNLIG